MSNSILCCLTSQCKDLVHTDIDLKLPANEDVLLGTSCLTSCALGLLAFSAR